MSPPMDGRQLEVRGLRGLKIEALRQAQGGLRGTGQPTHMRSQPETLKGHPYNRTEIAQA